MTQKKWKYKFLPLPKLLSNYEEILNEYGKYGFELCTIIPETSLAILKKPYYDE